MNERGGGGGKEGGGGRRGGGEEGKKEEGEEGKKEEKEEAWVEAHLVLATNSSRQGLTLDGPPCRAPPPTTTGKKFLAEGLQIAAGVPLECDEGPDFRTFRIGLFGLEKLHNHERTVGMLGAALDRMGIVNGR